MKEGLQTSLRRSIMSFIRFLNENLRFASGTHEDTLEPGFDTIDVCPMGRLFDSSRVSEMFATVEPELFRQIFETVVKKSIELQEFRLHQLGQALLAKDRTAISFYCHQLKGSYATTGAPLLASICNEIERACEEIPLKRIHQLSTLLFAFNGLFKREVAGFLNHESNSFPACTTPKS
jgi:HPt (histidine-containing phosphotransfer) domain-containing protein